MSNVSYTNLSPLAPAMQLDPPPAPFDYQRDPSLSESGGTEGQDDFLDAVHFCLLAEFDIDAGATLAYQYPYPTGTDE